MSNEENCPKFEWNIFNLCYQPNFNYAIIILNAGLEGNKDIAHIKKLWKNAVVRICVDGGTNEFYSYIHQQPSKNSKSKTSNFANDKDTNELLKLEIDEGEEKEVTTDIPIPDIISGDFDSIDHDILDFYKNAGTNIIPTPDQDETDFTKAFLVLKDHIAKHDLKINHIIAIAGITSSRFDHVLAHMNTLFKIKTIISYPVIIISGSSLIWVLDPGVHLIYIPLDLQHNKEKSWCGYASLSGPVTVSTVGLKWDVDKKSVIFGQGISTSNTYSDDFNGTVMVNCSDNLLWCMGCDFK